MEWDIGPWVETYGEGEVQLLAKRPVDKDPYPVVVTRDGNSVLWTVRKEDLWMRNKRQALLIPLDRLSRGRKRSGR